MQNIKQIESLPLEAIDAETVCQLIKATGDTADQFEDWWHGGDAWDLNIHGSEFDESLTGNQRRAVLYRLEVDAEGDPLASMHNEPTKEFTFDLPEDLPEPIPHEETELPLEPSDAETVCHLILDRVLAKSV